MNNMQKVGGYAAFLAGLGFVGILALYFGVLPSQGFKVPDDFYNPQALTKFSATLAVFNWIDILFGLTVVPFTLALRERLQAGAPNRMRLALVAASVATALFLGSGIMRMVSTPMVQNQAAGAGAILIVMAVGEGVENAGIFAAGFALVLLGWAGIATKGLPPGPCYVLLIAGVVGILSFLNPLIALLDVAVNVVWAFWFAMLLMKK